MFTRIKRLAAAGVAVLALGLGSPSAARGAELDLTTKDSFGFINGAIFLQNSDGPAGTGYIDPFVRIQAKGFEQGYNTDYRPFQFDEKNPLNYTHAILLADVPTTTINGFKFREFFLDFNERNNIGNRLISLDQFVLSSGTTNVLHAFSTVDKEYHAGGTSTLLYDMDAGMDNWVKMNADLQQGSGHFDLTVIVPEEYFAAATGPYLYLYSQFGTHYQTDAGFEEWTFGAGVRPPGTSEVPLPASAWGGLVLMAIVAGKRWMKNRREAGEVEGELSAIAMA